MIPAPLIAEIQQAVACEFGVETFEMSSARRSRAVAHPRQVAMFLARALTPRSTPEIGRMFGGRDHSTVIHAIRSVEARLRDDDELAARTMGVVEQLAALVDQRRSVAL